MQREYSFYVKGMHCQACVVLTESELSEKPEISKVKASLNQRSVCLTGDFGERTDQEISAYLSQTLEPHGYSLSIEKPKEKIAWADFQLAIPLALGFVVIFLLLQKLGIIQSVNASRVSYSTAFVIGLIASISTCMAVVGGLVLSLSANVAKHSRSFKPQILFHLGRLLSFFILGGVIGMIGSVFQFSLQGMLIIGIILALVMVILGLNLLDIFPWAKKLQPTLPSLIGRRVNNLKKLNLTVMPLLLGVATFFLPCGFTQSMQIYTLTTGNFVSGGLVMLSFALGTLPVLAILSFSAINIQDKNYSGVFFKTAGLIVIFFALFNLINTLAAAGLIPPVFNF